MWKSPEGLDDEDDIFDSLSEMFFSAGLFNRWKGREKGLLDYPVS